MSIILDNSAAVASKPTARDKLDLSRLQLSQLELMGQDIDLDAFEVQMKGIGGVDLVQAITAADVERSIEGASTVTVGVVDHDRKLLRSGQLHNVLDVELDGLWFRLAAVGKQGDQILLTFEDREIAVLRTYDKIIKQTQATSRGHVTRAEFIVRLLREVKEFKIPYVIPELHKKQPIEKDSDTTNQWGQNDLDQKNRGKGISYGADITVKGEGATRAQVQTANTILNVGASMILPRKLLVVSMMVAIQETSLRNATDAESPGTRSGVFQQDPRYWPASGDIATDAKAFFERLVKANIAHPNAAYYQLGEAVQNSGQGNLYAQWRTEAERLVTAYGLPNTSAAAANAQNAWQGGQGDYEFYRGEPPVTGDRKWKKENSWDCIQRLAEEVNWRAFFVSGIFYYMYEDELFKSRPIAIIDEDTDGVDSIDGDYDPGKKDEATVTVTARLGRWQAPPGSVIQLQNCGPWNGRWLVSTMRRSMYSPLGTIILKKPLPKLPEPGGSNLPSSSDTWTGAPVSAKTGGKFKVATATVQPLPVCEGKKTNDQGTHSTAGLPGYPAIDFMGNAGSAVVAPVSGTVTKLSGHPTSEGAVLGQGGPFGRSVYITTPGGSVVFITHLGDDVEVHEGQQVSAGQQIGTIGDYPGTTPDHVHIGVNTGNDGISVHTIANSPQAAC